MTAKSDLRLTDKEIWDAKYLSPAEAESCFQNPNVYAVARREMEDKKVAEAQLQKIIDSFGGQSNFEAVLKLVEQTRGKCPECLGFGEITVAGCCGSDMRTCPKCHGSGLGKVQIERIKVLAEDQRLPHIPSPTKDDIESAHCGQWFDDDWFAAGASQAQQDMFQAGFRKIAGGEVK